MKGPGSRTTLLAVLTALACAGDTAENLADDDVVFEDERRIDLTGDGVPEQVRVIGRGASYDSLRIVLEVRSDADSLLYHDRWWSGFYFKYIAPPAPTDTTAQRIVRGHLTELLRDTAFAPPAIVAGAANPAGVMPDAEAVRFDIAEFSWRRSAGVADTARLPPHAHDEIGELLVPESDVAALTGELARQPSFTYYAGGEVVYTIAWSPAERRFIRIRACC